MPAERGAAAVIEPSVLVLPAFSAADMAVAEPPDELQRWLDAYDLAAHDVPGVPAPVHAGEGIAVTPTGIGKPAAAATVSTLCAASGVDLADAHVLSVGVAGIAPAAGPLGSVVLAETVVDWDRKYRWGGGESAEKGDTADPDPPIAPLEFRTRDPAYQLDADLLDRVERAVAGADLRATADPRADGESGPAVHRGVSVCGDEFWYGEAMAGQVDWLLGQYGLGPHLATQMEDYATAAALARFDRLDRYAAVRAAANYDRPSAGESPARVTEGVGAFDFETATLNAFRAGRRVVETLR